MLGCARVPSRPCFSLSSYCPRSTVQTVILARCRQSEVQDLNRGFRDHDVTRLEIAMDDALGVCFRQGGSYLPAVVTHHCDSQGALFQPGGKCFALHQFHDQVVGANVVEGADVGVIQRRNGARLALETGTELLMRDLDGHGAA